MQSLASQLVRLLPHSDQSTDGELLAGFFSQATDDNFTELVRRHGPLVWGVCRRTLPDLADAEDAFQATFLVLVRLGHTLTRSSTIGPWLHRVATWTARNVRRGNARRLAKRAPISEQIAASSSDPDLALDLDSALLTLPEKYRSSIVLCHLLGYSRADAAVRLGCPEGTLSSWLARGLGKLRAKLGDLDPAKPLGVATIAVPAALTASTLKAAEASMVAVAVNSSIAHVVEGVIRMFWIKKATAATLALGAMFAFGIGVGLTGRQVEGVAGAQEKGSAKAPAKMSPPIDADVDKVIAELQKMILAAEDVYSLAKFGVDKVSKKIELAKSSKDYPAAQHLDDLITLSRFKENAQNAETRIKHLGDLIQKLKAARQKTKTDPDKTKELAATLKEARRAIEESRQAADRAAAEAKKVDTSSGYLELTIHGKAGQFEFSLRETDAAGREIGSVRVAQPAMLQKLLARAKLDPTAPKELRVIAEPPTALGGGPTAALTACDAAGFKTVRFTGYVPAGGYIPPLNLNQKGDAPGYTRYEKKERTANELLKEIGEGMTRF